MSQRSFCSGVPAIARISLLPESGAWQPNAFEAKNDVPEDLVHQPELQMTEALAAELRREVGGPQAPLLHLLLERRVDPVELRLVDVVLDRFDRPDLLADELAHPGELFLELRLGGEVPGHQQLLSSSRPKWRVL